MVLGKGHRHLNKTSRGHRVAGSIPTWGASKIGLSNVSFMGHPNSTLEPARIASSFDKRGSWTVLDRYARSNENSVLLVRAAEERGTLSSAS